MTMAAKKSYLRRLVLAVLAVLLFCALGAAVIVGWIPAEDGQVSDVLMLIESEPSHGQMHQPFP